MKYKEMYSIYNYLTAQPETEFTTKELNTALGIKVSTQAILNSALMKMISAKKKRVYSFYVSQSAVNANKDFVFPTENFSITDIEKRRERLYFINDAGLDFYYDFNSKFCSFPPIARSNACLSRKMNSIKWDIAKAILYRGIHIPEWLFSIPYESWATYATGFYTQADFDKYPKACPRGYAPWLEEYRKKMCVETVLVYQIKKFLMENGISLDEQTLNSCILALGSTLGLCSLFQMLDTLQRNIIDSKTYYFPFLEKIIKLYSKYHSIINGYFPSYIVAEVINEFPKESAVVFTKSINMKHTYKANIAALKALEETMQDEALSKQLSKTSKLNDFIPLSGNNSYIIKVPQNVEDLVDEGEQQHNCVGSFYNSSIRSGKNLIYFIREISAPSKSLVTCRYSTYEQKTVEHRIFANQHWQEPKEKKILAEIDEKIKEILDNETIE